MNKVMLALALAALVAGLALSGIANISVCMWGCPQTLELYWMQASIVVLAGSLGWVRYKLLRKHA